MAEPANVAGRSLISEAGTVTYAARSTVKDRPQLPRPKLPAPSPAAAVASSPTPLPRAGERGERAAAESAGPAGSTVRCSTPVTVTHKAGRRLQTGARRFDRLGMGALVLCLAALLCAMMPRVCALVIPLSVAGALAGLSALVLVSYAAQKRLLLPLAGAAGSGAILLAASFFPQFLGPVYLGWRAKGDGDPTVIRAVPIEGVSAPLDPEWVDAAKAALQMGRINVRVLSVSIRRAGAAETSSGKKIAAGNYCFVRIRTQEFVTAGPLSAKQSETLSSQIESASPKLTGSGDKSYELHGALKAEGTAKQRERHAFPVTFLDQVFIFEAPAARPNYLRLEIAAEAWGGKGAFRFTIPASMIIDEQGTFKKRA